MSDEPNNPSSPGSSSDEEYDPGSLPFARSDESASSSAQPSSSSSVAAPTIDISRLLSTIGKSVLSQQISNPSHTSGTGDNVSGSPTTSTDSPAPAAAPAPSTAAAVPSTADTSSKVASPPASSEAIPSSLASNLLPSTDARPAYQSYPNNPYQNTEILPWTGHRTPVDDFIDSPMSPEEIQAYEAFARNEAGYISGKIQEKFPPNSRMFVGNLPTSKISKAQVFRIFSKHGPIAQISMKSAYGFIQFLSADVCSRALHAEQGLSLRGTHLQLELSKPQSKSSSSSSSNPSHSHRRHRERSPSRYSSSRDRDRERDRDRDSYRRRSPPPPPPDCVILQTERLDPRFVSHIEHQLNENGFSTVVDHLGRRPLESVIQRMAYDGAKSVIVLNYPLQMADAVNFQIFTQAPDGSIRFDEYLKTKIDVAINLLNHSRQRDYSGRRYGDQRYDQRYDQHSSSSSYLPSKPSSPPYSRPHSYQQPSSDPASSLLASLQNMDPDSLQKVVAALQNQTPSTTSLPSYPHQFNPPPSSSQAGQDVKSIMEQLAMLQDK